MHDLQKSGTLCVIFMLAKIMHDLEKPEYFFFIFMQVNIFIQDLYYDLHIVHARQ